MKLQTFALEYWMDPEYFDEDGDEDMARSYPVIDSPLPQHLPDAVYFRRDTGECWFVSEGVSRKYDATDFKYKLGLKHAESLTPEQVAGLVAICKSNLATKRQRQLLRNYNDYMGVRATGRDAAKMSARFFKEIEAEENAVNE